MAIVLVLASTAAAEPHDGAHDFDFQLGKWKVKLKKLDKPLHNSHTWIDFTGSAVVRSLMNGKGQVEELELESTSAGKFEGMAVRLYSPASHQWSLYWNNVKNGHFDVPTVGEFKGDRGEFFDQEMFEGRMILVRFVISNITKTSAHFEQSFSDDGGATWEPNWIADQTRAD